MINKITTDMLEDYLNFTLCKQINEKFIVLYYYELDNDIIAVTYITEPRNSINILETYLNRQPTGSWASRAIITTGNQETHTTLLHKHTMFMRCRTAKINSILDE